MPIKIRMEGDAVWCIVNVNLGGITVILKPLIHELRKIASVTGLEM